MNGPIDVAPGIARIAIGTPWPVGPVNVYVLDDDPLTLIDTGQRTPEALADLEAGLRALGRRVEDLERIVVTHQHIDHCGLAATLVRRSGAELCALAPMADWLSGYPGSAEAEDDFEHAILERHGARPVGVERGPNRGALRYGAPAFVQRRLADGDALESARRRLRVLHRPGTRRSTPCCTTSSTGCSSAVTICWPGRPRRSWRPHSESTPATAGRARSSTIWLRCGRPTRLSLDTVLPGHGDAVDDHRTRRSPNVSTATRGSPARPRRRYARPAHRGRDRHRDQRAGARAGGVLRALRGAGAPRRADRCGRRRRARRARWRRRFATA